MDVIVTGRHCSVSDDLRNHVVERMQSIERLQERAIRAEVEFTATDNKGSHDSAIEAEVTLRSKGPVIRAEASASDKTVAFEKAMEKLKSRLRKASDRRKRDRGLRAVPVPDQALLAESAPDDALSDAPETTVISGITVTGDGPLVVREKEFSAVPLSLEQALDEMELVGHDFFLYLDADTQRPSVVYRRKAYDYGVIHLAVQQ